MRRTHTLTAALLVLIALSTPARAGSPRFALTADMGGIGANTFGLAGEVFVTDRWAVRARSGVAIGTNDVLDEEVEASAWGVGLRRYLDGGPQRFFVGADVGTADMRGLFRETTPGVVELEAETRTGASFGGGLRMGSEGGFTLTPEIHAVYTFDDGFVQTVFGLSIGYTFARAVDR